jgi:hypothetical protein
LSETTITWDQNIRLSMERTLSSVAGKPFMAAEMVTVRTAVTARGHERAALTHGRREEAAVDNAHRQQRQVELDAATK